MQIHLCNRSKSGNKCYKYGNEIDDYLDSKTFVVKYIHHDLAVDQYGRPKLLSNVAEMSRFTLSEINL